MQLSGQANSNGKFKYPLKCNQIQAVLDDKKERIIHIILHTSDGKIMSVIKYCDGYEFSENHKISLQKTENGLMFFSINEYSVGFSEGILEENQLNNTLILNKMLEKLEEIKRIVQIESTEQITRENNISTYSQEISDENIMKNLAKLGIKILTNKISKRLASETKDKIKFITNLIIEIENLIQYNSKDGFKGIQTEEYIKSLEKTRIILIDIKTRLESKLKAEIKIMEIYGITYK